MMRSLPSWNLKLSGFVLIHLYLAASSRLYASETPRKIYGWPLSEKSLSDIALNQDAIMGTFVCPALTRLNLQAAKSEPVLLQSVSTAAGGAKWVLTLKPGLKWWSGKAVEASDLEEFLKGELPKISERVFGKALAASDFKTEKTDKAVTITFAKAPGFGPYILDRAPFARGSQSNKLECAGPLSIHEKNKDIVLEGDLSGKARKIILMQEAPKTETKDDYLSFRFGNELHPSTWVRQIEEEMTCKIPIELPIVTVVAWNPKGQYTKDEEFRRAMTSILPRGALLRAGAGSLGELISAPIIKSHPGYKKSLLVLPYDLKKADTILNAMNLVRSEKDGYRRTPSGEVMEISIASDPSKNSGLLHKILDDSFRALGIRFKMTSDKANADGILTGIELEWPENDLTSLLHSKKSQNVWPWTYNFPEIDAAMEKYNLSLSQEKPDFALLQRIHELVMKREPFSVLVQHKSCMQYGKAVKTPSGVPNTKNPDWIRAVLER